MQVAHPPRRKPPPGPPISLAQAADRPSDAQRATAELLNYVAATWARQDVALRQHTQAIARAQAR
ncbi:hypothetical protein [Streptomyces sp. NPDC002853]